MTTPASNTPENNTVSTRNVFRVDVMGFLVQIARSWKILTATTLIGGCLAALYALHLPLSYEATVVFLPPPPRDRIPGTASGSGSSAAQSLLGAAAQIDTYLGLMASRSLLDDVLDHTELAEMFKGQKRVEMRRTLSSMTKLDTQKNTLLSVTVTMGDPKIAAHVANAYLDALYRLNSNMVTSAAARRREFYEKSIKDEQGALEAAEEGFRANEKRTGVLLPEAEAAAGLAATSRLQGTLDNLEQQLSTLLLSQTERSPQVVSLRSQIASTRAQIARSQGGPAARSALTSDLPGLTLENAHKLKELRRREAISESLQSAADSARLLESDPGPQIQVVDVAIPPDVKSGPPRVRITEVGTLFGFLLGAIYILFAKPFLQFLESFRRRLRSA